MPLSIRRIGLALTLLSACFGTSNVLGSSLDAPGPVMAAQAKAIPDRYIVVLKDGGNARSVAAVAGVQPTHVYTAALNGFAATLTQGQLTALRHNPSVAYVEQDQEVALSPPRTWMPTAIPGAWIASISATCRCRAPTPTPRRAAA